MIEKTKFILYLIAVLLLTTIHSKIFYSVLIVTLFILNLRFLFYSIVRVLMSFLAFNLIITLSYTVYTFYTSKVDLDYLILINLRVFTISYLTAFFVRHTNLSLAFAFSDTLSYLFTITYSQILNFVRTYGDLIEAHKSRVIYRERRHLKGLIARMINLFFTKSIYNAKETSLAMRSRGLIDD